MAWGKRDWERHARLLGQNSACVFVTQHAQQQMRKRHISMTVLFDVIRNGVIRREPEPDIKTGHTVCRMERFSSGKNIAVNLAFEAEKAPQCIVVTTFVTGE